MENTMIEVQDVCKRFKEQEVLKHVDLSVHKGEICGIMGRNGSGKTVLFKCICQIFLPDQGIIKIDGQDIAKNRDIVHEIGAIIENPAYLENFTGFQNLSFLAGIQNRINKQEIREVLKLVGLEQAAGKKVKKYSMGMRQRLAIAQAVMEKQQIQILDEPMNGLDKSGVEEIRQLLLELKERGNTILIASHNPLDMELLCDSIYEMDSGTLNKMM